MSNEPIVRTRNPALVGALPTWRTNAERQMLRRFHNALRGDPDHAGELGCMDRKALDDLWRRLQAECADLKKLIAELVEEAAMADPADPFGSKLDMLLQRQADHPARSFVTDNRLAAIAANRHLEIQEQEQEARKLFAERQDTAPLPRKKRKYDPFDAMYDRWWGTPWGTEDNSRFFGILVAT
jgi:hypothetical protein